MNSEVSIVIPARYENGKLGNRNLLSFGKSNLLCHKLDVLNELEINAKIYVSSDDEDILLQAKEHDAIPLLRPKEYTKSHFIGKFICHICEQVATDHIMFTYVTAPLITSKTYLDMFESYERRLEEGYDSLISVISHRAYILDETGSLNFKVGDKFRESASLPNLYMYTKGATIASRNNLLRWKFFWGKIPIRYQLNKIESLSIYDEYDYEICKKIYEG